MCARGICTKQFKRHIGLIAGLTKTTVSDVGFGVGADARKQGMFNLLYFMRSHCLSFTSIIMHDVK